MIGLSSLVLALAGGVQATEFQLDTDTPDSLCPELSMTRSAVRQRLGQLETEAGRRWHGVYSNVHDPTGRHGDYVRLVIRDAEGHEQLKRELPMQGESCETLAQAIALVVDGYFRELAQTPARDDSADSARHVDTTATAAPSKAPAATSGPVMPVASASVAAKAPVPPPANTTRPKWGLAVGAGYESAPAKPIATVGLFTAQPEHWRWGVRFGLPLSQEHETGSLGTAAAYVVPARSSLSYVFEPAARVQWLLGPDVLVSLEHGSTQGVPGGRSGWRVSSGVGAQTALVYWANQSVAIAASLDADRVLFQSRRFLMDGQPVLELSRTRFSGTVGIWAVISP